jgi:hypothetical protein
MNATHRYSYDLPRRAVAFRAAFLVAVSVLALLLSKRFERVAWEGVVAGVALAFLAEIEVVRHLAYRRFLELTDDAALFPCGFLWPQMVAIPWADIVRVLDYGGSLALVTDRHSYSIAALRFSNVEDYRAAREFISAKMAVALPPYVKQGRGILQPVVLPPPLVRWVEPEDWCRYQTHVAKSKPLLAHLRSETWFFARCLAFILFPWLLLRLCQLYTTSATGFFVLSVSAAFFFTMLHWLSATFPGRVGTEISFYDNGIGVSLCNGQTADWSYYHLLGWAVIERRFQDRALSILLLRASHVFAFGLPGDTVRSQVVQTLTDKRVPHATDLKPPWELP